MPPRAMPALAPGLLRCAGAEGERPDADTVPARVLGSLAPLLDLAFGIEGEAAFPDEIAALVESLHAGPLGPATAPPARADLALEASA